MDELKQSAISFGKLFPVEYELIAGSKKTLINLTLSFSKEQYMHLAGLHKLTDLQLQRYSKGKLYDMILNGELTYDYVQKSTFFSEVKERLHLLSVLEQALDSNELIIKYKRGFAKGTTINAEYIITYKLPKTILHYFIDKESKSGKYIGKSIFGRNDDKFFIGQQTFKVLKKYKRNLSVGCIQILTDKEVKTDI